MKRSKFFICDYNQWVKINDSRVSLLSEDDFKDILEKHCQKYDPKYPQLYKRLANNEPYCFITNETMQNNIHIDYEFRLSPLNWKTFPDKRRSLECFNYKDNEHGNLYIVIPYDGASFGISPGCKFNESIICESKNLVDQGFTRAYYNDPIKWLKGLTKRELWTSESCLLISYQQWEKMFSVY